MSRLVVWCEKTWTDIFRGRDEPFRWLIVRDERVRTRIIASALTVEAHQAQMRLLDGTAEHEAAMVRRVSEQLDSNEAT